MRSLILFLVFSWSVFGQCGPNATRKPIGGGQYSCVPSSDLVKKDNLGNLPIGTTEISPTDGITTPKISTPDGGVAIISGIPITCPQSLPGELVLCGDESTNAWMWSFGGGAYTPLGGVGGSGTTGTIAKFTGSVAVGDAVASNVVALFGSGSCSGYLHSSGACSVPESVPAPVGFWSTPSAYAGAGVSVAANTEVRGWCFYRDNPAIARITKLVWQLNTADASGCGGSGCTVEIGVATTAGAILTRSGSQAMTGSQGARSATVASADLPGNAPLWVLITGGGTAAKFGYGSSAVFWGCGANVIVGSTTDGTLANATLNTTTLGTLTWNGQTAIAFMAGN